MYYGQLLWLRLGLIKQAKNQQQSNLGLKKWFCSVKKGSSKLFCEIAKKTPKTDFIGKTLKISFFYISTIILLIRIKFPLRYKLDVLKEVFDAL